MSETLDIERWVDRVGAALAAPRRALAVSDAPKGQGRASSDIALLLLLAIIAVETHLFVTAGFLLHDGSWGDAFTIVLVGARERLAMPIVLLLAAALALTLIAGKRRSPSRDFDLACVALIPLVLCELVNALLFQLGVEAQVIAIYVGYCWSGAVLALAYLQTRRRPGGR